MCDTQRCAGLHVGPLLPLWFSVVSPLIKREVCLVCCTAAVDFISPLSQSVLQLDLAQLIRLQTSKTNVKACVCPHSLSLRTTIRNAKSIHSKGRRRLSQETYRRNSCRYLQQKGSRLSEPQRNSAKSPLKERKNQGK